MFIVFIILCIVLVKSETPEMLLEKDMLYRLNTEDFGYYEITESTNIINCDLMTFSSIVNRMTSDGYVIVKEDNTSDFIDVLLSNNDLSFRLHYSHNEILTSICKVYEKSYIPFTYITGK